jgi:hypothetical protein
MMATEDQHERNNATEILEQAAIRYRKELFYDAMQVEI